MSTTTPVQGLPIPELPDAANGPTAFQNLGNALEKKLVMVFATTATRLAAIPAPTEGMLSYQLDTHQYEHFNGTAWVPEPKRVQSGILVVNTTTAITSIAGTQVFPTAFSAAPVVTVTPNTGGLSGHLAVKVTSISATQFAANFYNSDGTNFSSAVAVGLNWIAIGA